MTGGPFELRPALTNVAGDGEDYSIVCTVAGSGSLTGTFELKVFDPAGTAVSSGVSCSITSAGDREVTGVIAGLNLAAGVYRWYIRKTDSGSRVYSAWGTLVVENVQRV